MRGKEPTRTTLPGAWKIYGEGEVQVYQHDHQELITIPDVGGIAPPAGPEFVTERLKGLNALVVALTLACHGARDMTIFWDGADKLRLSIPGQPESDTPILVVLQK